MAHGQVGWKQCVDKDDASMMTLMIMMVRTSTTKERDGNLLPPGDAAQRNSRGLP